MTSIVRIVRDWWRGIPKDVALDSSQIIENLLKLDRAAVKALPSVPVKLLGWKP